MSQTIENNKRIAKNTLALYFRMFFIMAISLFTSRVILRALGVIDFGIYNVVAGVVAMMGILNNAMGVATTRYITFELGKGKKNFEMLHKTFCISFTVYILLASIFLVLAETVGLWFVNTQLQIPEQRMCAANWCYQFAILTVINSLFVNPYNAVIQAHEKMATYAYISIIECILKLLIVYMLYIGSSDKLILYGFLFLMQSVVITMIYRIYCIKKFPEAHFKYYKDPDLLKKLFAYSGWNLFGSISQMVKGQGLNILLNMFFNPTVNAARGIAYQVNNAIYQFTGNFFNAVRPQITKYYAQNDYENLFKLIYRSSKFSYYLLLIISLPIVIEAPFIIQLWLGQLPDNVVIFVRIIIAISSIEALSHPITSLIHATGKVATYQLVIGIVTILIVPISWYFLKRGAGPISVFFVSLVINAIALYLRVICARRLIVFSVSDFCLQVFGISFLVTVCSAIFPILLYTHVENTIWNVLIVCIVSILCTLLSIYSLGLRKDERSYINKFVKNKLSHK